MPPPFLFARSRGLWEGEDGKNGRTIAEDSGKLRWIAASAMAEGPRTRSVLRPEQWPHSARSWQHFATVPEKKPVVSP
jgi:hypothetical protein